MSKVFGRMRGSRLAGLPGSWYLDDGRITHLILVRLKILFYDSFWGGSGFSFPALQ